MLDRVGDANFYAAMVEDGREEAAERRLKKYGFVTFLPMVHVQVRVLPTRQRPTRTDRRPALPGYVFVWMPDMGANWGGLRRIPNVQGVVGVDDRPYPLSYSVLCEFWQRVQMDAFERSSIRARLYDALATDPLEDGDKPEFRAGDSVRILSGMCEGQEHEVHEVVGKKARMYLFLFNQRVLSTVTLDSLELIA